MTGKHRKLSALAFSALILMAGLAVVGVGASSAVNQPIWTETVETDSENVTVSAYNSTEVLTAYLIAPNQSQTLIDQGQLDATNETVATTALEPTTADAWHNTTDLPNVLSDSGAASVNGTVYVFGGQNSSHITNEGYRLNRTAGSWEAVADLGTRRDGLGGVSLNGYIYAVGGFSPNGVLSSVERYDPATGSWTTVTPLPEVKSSGAVTTYNGSIYVMGGTATSGLPDNSSFRYDPAADSWTGIASFPADKGEVAGASVNGSIYVLGGGSATLHQYDPATDTWSTGTSAPWTLTNPELFEMDGKLHAVGDQNHSVYDPSTDSWSTIEGITFAKTGSLAVTSESAYLIGGRPATGHTNATTRYGPISEYVVEVGPSTATAGEIVLGEIEAPSNGSGGGGGGLPGGFGGNISLTGALVALLLVGSLIAAALYSGRY